MTPEDAALFEAAAQPFIDRVIDEARRTGQHEPSEAYAVDGLRDMAISTMTTTTGVAPDVATAAAKPNTPTDAPATDAPATTDDEPTGSTNPDASAPTSDPRPPRGGRGRRRLGERRELIGIVNLESLRRGTVEPGEMCEIAGVGPIPLDIALAVFGEALLRIVIRDGVDIRTVVHTGRTANALQETAVLVRQDGRCDRPRCDLPICEIDHTTGYTTNRQTTLDDLGGLCGHDHDLKTRHGHTYQRLPDGTIQWLRPDGTIEEGRPPP